MPGAAKLERAWERVLGAQASLPACAREKENSLTERGRQGCLRSQAASA